MYTNHPCKPLWEEATDSLFPSLHLLYHPHSYHIPEHPCTHMPTYTFSPQASPSIPKHWEEVTQLGSKCCKIIPNTVLQTPLSMISLRNGKKFNLPGSPNPRAPSWSATSSAPPCCALQRAPRRCSSAMPSGARWRWRRAMLPGLR